MTCLKTKIICKLEIAKIIEIWIKQSVKQFLKANQHLKTTFTIAHTVALTQVL